MVFIYLQVVQICIGFSQVGYAYSSFAAAMKWMIVELSFSSMSSRKSLPMFYDLTAATLLQSHLYHITLIYLYFYIPFNSYHKKAFNFYLRQ